MATRTSKNLLRKTLSLFLALVMALSVMSVQAFAAGNTQSSQGRTITIKVGEKGTYTYSTPVLDFNCPYNKNLIIHSAHIYQYGEAYGDYDDSILGDVDCGYNSNGYDIDIWFTGLKPGTTTFTFETSVYFGNCGNHYCSNCGQYHSCANYNWYDRTITFTVVVEDDEPETDTLTVTFKDGTTNNSAFAEQTYEDIEKRDNGNYTDLFNTDGGTAKVDEQRNPVREGYTFAGWNKSESGNTVTYTAQWTEAPKAKYTVTYTDGVDEEVVFDDQSYEVEEGAATPAFQFNGVSGAEPTREGYKFEGWAPTVAETVTENATYEATWSKVEESETHITVEFNDGEANGTSFAPQHYYPVKSDEVNHDYTYLFNTHENLQYAPHDEEGNPVRTGYIFRGWARSEDANGNVTYAAQWEKIVPQGPTPSLEVLQHYITGVTVNCVTEEGKHNSETYQVLEGSYTVSGPQSHNGSGDWYSVTIYPEKYVAEYSGANGQHTLSANSAAQEFWFKHSASGSGNNEWLLNGSSLHTTTATFNVEHETVEPPVDDAPTFNDLAGLLKIHIYDTTEDNGFRLHGEKTYDLSDETYEVSEPDENGKYTVTVKTEQYVNQFNVDTGVQHTTDEQAVSAVVFKDTDEQWKVDVDGTTVSTNHSISVAVKCEKPEPQPDPDAPVMPVPGNQDARPGSGNVSETAKDGREFVLRFVDEAFPAHNWYWRGYQAFSSREKWISVSWTEGSITATLTFHGSNYLNDIYNEKNNIQHTFADNETPDKDITITWDAQNHVWVPDVSELVFYIKCNQKDYTVTFDPNGGTWSDGETDPRSVTVHDDDTTDLEYPPIGKDKMPDDPIREGYIFDGWRDELGKEVKDDYTVGGDVKVHATWKEDANKNNIPDDEETRITVTFEDGQGNTLQECEDVLPRTDGNYEDLYQGNGDPTREGYVFTGWDKSVDETTGNVTYTAQWAEDKDGDGIPDNKEGHYHVLYQPSLARNLVKEMPADVLNQLDGTTVSLSGNPQSSGYVFLGWTLTDSPKPVTSKEQTSYPLVTQVTIQGQNVTVFAVWAVDANNNGTPDGDEYTVEFNPGEGSWTDSTESGTRSVEPNGTLGSDMPKEPTRDGYIFDGWYDAQTGVEFTGDTSVTGDVTVTAQWKCDGNHVDEDGDGKCDKDNCGATSHTVTYTDGVNGEAFDEQTYTVWDDAIPDFNSGESQAAVDENGNPTREGYTFNGWSETVDEATGNVTYTAQWTQNSTGGGGGGGTTPGGGGTTPGGGGTTPGGGETDPGDEDIPDEDVPQADTHTVTVHYVDDEGNTIAPDTDDSWPEGNPYFVDIPEIEGYTYDHAEGETFFPDLTEDVEVTLVYTADVTDIPDEPEPPLAGTHTVTVHYVDEAGSTIAEDLVVDWPEGSPYLVETPVIDGYTYDHTVGDTFYPTLTEDVEVTVVYTRDEQEPATYTVTVRYIDTNGNTLLPASVTTYAAGAAYTVTAPSINGYLYYYASGAVSGIVTGDVAVTLVYVQDTYVPSTTPTYPTVPSDPTPSNPSVDIPDGDVPQTDLPDTGDDGTVDITDEDVPLAGAEGLNTRDHINYIIGTPEGKVLPNNAITRAEAATIFFRLMTEPYRVANWSTVNSFSDVKSGSWYNNAVSTCANAGKLLGTPDGSFQPNRSITRAEFATIAVRFMMDGYNADVEVSDFSDTVGHWASASIRRAVQAGWITGMPDGTFHPDDPITRAEAVTIVNRMLGRVPHKDGLLAGMRTFSDNMDPNAWYYLAIQEAANYHDYGREAAVSREDWSMLNENIDWKQLEKEWVANGGYATTSAAAE